MSSYLERLRRRMWDGFDNQQPGSLRKYHDPKRYIHQYHREVYRNEQKRDLRRAGNIERPRPDGAGNYTFPSYNGPLDYGYSVGTGTKFAVKDFGSGSFCRKCMDQGCYHCAEDKSYMPRNAKRKYRQALSAAFV